MAKKDDLQTAVPVSMLRNGPDLGVGTIEENASFEQEDSDEAGSSETARSANPALDEPSDEGRSAEPPAFTAPLKSSQIRRPESSSQFLQEAAKLVHRLFRTPGAPALNSVLFCGVDRAFNSTSICCRTAEILASQVQKTVCVVDANYRLPRVHEHFGIDNPRGFADALVKTGPIRSFARQLPSGNLWVMTAGAVPAGGLAISSSEMLRSRMLELRGHFDYVVVDAAPAGLYIDALVLGQLVDGAVLVIEPKTTRRETAFQVKESLEAAKVHILGAVLQAP